MRPKIGITSWHYRDGDERWEAVLEDYAKAVLEAGGLPLILPTTRAESALINAYLETINGLILTGGADIHPVWYGQTVLDRCGEIDEERDRFEIELARAACSRDLPCLGICRGLQIVNVAMGGSLYQDLSYRTDTDPAHQSPRELRREPVHGVTVLQGSCLAEILKVLEFDVTSTHHQIIKDLAPGLTINAVAPDGVIEGIEGAGSFLLAVHWHPERMFARHPEQRALFRALIEAAGKKFKGHDSEG